MKKLIIITYYWPPSGGGGVQRWLKFAKYLPEFGWEPIVVIPKNAEYPTTDASLQKDIPNDLKIIEVPIWEPYDLFKKLTGKKSDTTVNSGFLFDDEKQSFTQKLSLWIRGNLLIPDPRCFWISPVVKELSSKIEEIKPDAIVTTGPPHSLHLIGLKLQRKYNVKWLADFRDPWSTIDYLDKFYLTKWARKRQTKLEHKVLQQADTTLAVSKNWEKELITLGASKTAVITNGFDASDFLDFKPVTSDDFIIAHTGFISSFRNPEVLWKAISDTSEENKELKKRLKLQFTGSVDKAVFTTINKHTPLKESIINIGYVPHNEVFDHYASATVLLLLLNNSDNSTGHIPGKLFEYLGTGKPILALGKKGGDVDLILEETGAGKLFDFKDTEGIKHYLKELYNKNKVVTSDLSGISKFERRSLTEQLSKVLNQL